MQASLDDAQVSCPLRKRLPSSFVLVCGPAQITGAFYPLKQCTAARCGTFAIKSEARYLLQNSPSRFSQSRFPAATRIALALRRELARLVLHPEVSSAEEDHQDSAISLPASLSPCGRVRYSSPVRWITCILDAGNRRCRRYRSSNVSPRCHRRFPEMCENPPGLPLQVCESFHSYRAHSSGYSEKKLISRAYLYMIKLK